MRRRITSGYFDVKCEAFGARMKRVLSTAQCRKLDRGELENIGRVAFLGAMSRFDPSRGADLFSYAFRRIVAAVATFARSERRQMRRTGSIDAPEIMCSFSDTLKHDDGTETKMLVQDIFSLSRLERVEQDVVTMSLAERRSYRSIAGQIGVSRDTVSRVLKGALKKIHDRFPDGEAMLA